MITPQLRSATLVKAGIVERDGAVCLFAAADIIINEPLNKAAFKEVLFDYFGDILLRYAAVKCALRINDYNGAERAKPEAAGLNDLDLIRKTLLCKLFRKFGNDLHRAGGSTSGTAADQNV